MSEKLYLSPFEYLHICGVEALEKEVLRRAGVLGGRDEVTIHIRDTEHPEFYPDFNITGVSWCGWSFTFVLNDYVYHISGDDNPFFNSNFSKKKVGVETKCREEFFLSFSESKDIETRNKENEEEAKKLCDWLINHAETKEW